LQFEKKFKYPAGSFMKQEQVEIVRFQEASLDLDLKNQHFLFEKPDLLLALFVLENRNIFKINI